MQSALSHRHCSLGKDFHSSSDWGCFLAFAFCIIHTKHLAVKIMSCLSPSGPCLSFPAGLGSLAGMGKSDPGGEGRKIMAILTTGWSLPDGLPASHWQNDGRVLMASFSQLLIGLYEYLMKSRWNSIRNFTCYIFRKERRKRNGEILLDSSSHRAEAMCPEIPLILRCHNSLNCPSTSTKSKRISQF